MAAQSPSPLLRTRQPRDTIDQFSKDVQHVLHVLKASEFGSDPNIPDVYRNPIYDREEWWNRHISRTRYLRYLVDFPTKSKLLQRTLPQLSVLFLWSCLAIAMSHRDMFVAKLHIGLTPMSLVSAFVASLLTLRGNQGLNRLRDARQVIGQVGLQTREMVQLIAISVYPIDQEMGLLAARHVSIFLWLLKAHLQDTNDTSDIIKTMLPNPKDAYYITNYKRKTPVAIVIRLRQIFSHMAFEDKIRLLLFYLFWLPLSLYGTLQNGPATLLVTAAVGYAMLGLDEIAHILELPFRFMPLRQLCKLSTIESADAMVYQPPPLHRRDDGCHRAPPPNPPYWYREQKARQKYEKKKRQKYD